MDQQFRYPQMHQNPRWLRLFPLLISCQQDVQSIPCEMQPYETMVSPALYTPLAVVTSVVGFLLTMGFFIYQFTYNKKERSINLEFLLAFLAALFGSAGLFLLGLSVGIYF